MRAKTDRNDKIVALHDFDPKKYSFRVLGRKYKIKWTTAHQIYQREKAKTVTVS